MMVAVNVAAIAINIVGVKQCFKEGTLVVCLNENGEEVQVCRRFCGEKTAGSENRRAIFFREAKPPACTPMLSKVIRIIGVGL